MSASSSLCELAFVSASQWGMITTAQATARGISRVQVARLADAGHFERLAHGVYKDSSVASDEFTDIRAAWLSVEPNRSAEARLGDGIYGVIISAQTAAFVHGIGDLQPYPYFFGSQSRRQSQRPDIRFRHKTFAPDQITIANGLPVTTIERTIADLVEDNEDLSLVGNLLGDAVRSAPIDLKQLAKLLRPLAARNGYRKGDGNGLLQELLELGDVDIASQIRRVVANPAWQAVARATESALAGSALNLPNMSALLAKSINLPDMSTLIAKSLATPDISAALAKAITVPDMSAIIARSINLPDMSTHVAKSMSIQRPAVIRSIEALPKLTKDIGTLEKLATGSSLTASATSE